MRYVWSSSGALLQGKKTSNSMTMFSISDRRPTVTSTLQIRLSMRWSLRSTFSLDSQSVELKINLPLLTYNFFFLHFPMRLTHPSLEKLPSLSEPSQWNGSWEDSFSPSLLGLEYYLPWHFSHAQRPSNRCLTYLTYITDCLEACKRSLDENYDWINSACKDVFSLLCAGRCYIFFKNTEENSRFVLYYNHKLTTSNWNRITGEECSNIWVFSVPASRDSSWQGPNVSYIAKQQDDRLER